jgi:hypothetical protein
MNKEYLNKFLKLKENKEKNYKLVWKNMIKDIPNFLMIWNYLVKIFKREFRP